MSMGEGRQCGVSKGEGDIVVTKGEGRLWVQKVQSDIPGAALDKTSSSPRRVIVVSATPSAQ